MTSLSVVLITHTGEIGGAEAALLRLIDVVDREAFTLRAVVFAQGPLVEELRLRGLDVTLLDGNGVERLTRAQTSDPWSVFRSLGSILRLAWRLRSHLAGGHPELVVANSLKAAVLCGIVTPLVGRRWVWHLHDRVSPDYLPRPARFLLRTIARWGPRAVIANSHATARTVGRTRSTVVAYPGVPSTLFTLPLHDDPHAAVGIVGRISATKGQRQFLRAIELLGEEPSDMTFRIVGAALFEDASEEELIRQIIAGSRALAGVEWAGWTDDSIGEIRRLALLVHASPVPEPFGQVVVEAMALGTPVIATDAGGVPEILAPTNERVAIGDGVSLVEYGLLVRPDDAYALAEGIRWALTNSDEIELRAQRARQSAFQRFTIERTRDAVVGVWARSMPTI